MLFQECVHCPVESFRPAVGEKMRARQNFQFRTRNAFGDQLRVTAQDHIVRTGNHKHRHGQRCQCCRINHRVVDHESKQLCMTARFRAFCGKAAGNPVTNFDRPLRPSADACRIQVGAVENQRFDARRMLEREAQGDIPAVGKAEQMCFLDVVRPEKFVQIRCKLTDGKRRRSARRLAVAAGIDRDDAVMRRKCVELMDEIGMVFSVAMEQNEREACTAFFVCERDFHIGFLSGLPFGKHGKNRPDERHPGGHMRLIRLVGEHRRRKVAVAGIGQQNDDCFSFVFRAFGDFDGRPNRCAGGNADQHAFRVADFFAGLFYLCWVPVPVLFALSLFIKGRRELALRFSLVFLLVNLIGFAGYYIHPAAPPWYVMQYGFEPILGTPGNVAGLGRFDALAGMDIFAPMYGRNANVFAALPSLHSAYMPVAFTYAVMGRCKKWLIALFGIIMVGIWFTAIYSGHHYMIDVLTGIACAVIGILLFEQVFMRLPVFRRFMFRYIAYIS